MIIELNIGLNVTGGENGEAAVNLRANRAIALLQASVFCANIHGARHGDSVSEPTLIVKLGVSCETRAQREIELISELLQQDCIAWYNATEYTGALLGPKAAAWGEFDPQYFLRFDANRPKALILKRASETQDQLAARIAAQRAA